MHLKFLLALACLVLLLPLAAATDMSAFQRGGTVESVTGLVGTYKSGCAAFTWDSVSDADFNNFVLQTSSNQVGLSIDINLNNRSDYTLCTLAPGNYIVATVYRIDGNASFLPGDGNQVFWKNVAPDASYRVEPGSPQQGASYLMFNFIATLGAWVSVIIFVFVISTFVLVVFGRLLLKPK